MDENPEECPANICKNLIDKADIIILSSGSQWTSLIPTYLFDGVNDAIRSNKHAKKYVIMNNIEDKDSYGVGSNDFIKIVTDRGLDLSNFTILENNDAVESLRQERHTPNLWYV